MKKHKRRRVYVCETGFTKKRDAEAEAKGIREIGWRKVTVKPDGVRGFKVCRTGKKKVRA